MLKAQVGQRLFAVDTYVPVNLVGRFPSRRAESTG